MTPEGKLVDYLSRKAKASGFVVRKLSYEGRRGAPDRLILAPGVAYFVEVKAPGKKLRPEQERELKLLRDAGLRAYWVATTGGVEMLLAMLRSESIRASKRSGDEKAEE